MTGFLGAWVAVLTALTALNLLLLLGVVRRLRDSAGGPAAQHRDTGDGGPAPGDSVPDFTMTDTDGAVIDAADLRDDTVLLFLSTSCPPCRELVDGLPATWSDAVAADRPAAVAFVVGADRDPAGRELLARLPAEVRAVATSEPTVDAVFGVTAYPSVFLIRHGVVDAVSHRLDEVLAARSVGRGDRAGSVNGG